MITENKTSRAGLYIRVSREIQAEKVSPEIQEMEEREYCNGKGYFITEIYKDIEKYRVGSRLVEPSGSRPDRPGFTQMIKDAYTGKFDVIIAWREDRLYRGYRPMLDILDCIDATGVKIELVRETFDERLAPVKAWAAKMELDARRDRTTMGMIGRLTTGKIAAGCSSAPFGYDYSKNTGNFVVNTYETEWVKKIWQWFGEGIAAYEIRRRLIENAVKQKGKKKRKYKWHISIIKNILKRDDYFTGIFKVTWEGQEYEVPIPKILDAEIYQAVVKQREKWKNHPAGRSKQFNDKGEKVNKPYALAAGVIYCVACSVKMGIVRVNNGQGKIYKYYRCPNYHNDCSLAGCAKIINAEKLDEEIWKKVWGLISEEGALEKALEERIASLDVKEKDAKVDHQRIENELSELLLERQKVITWARKKVISEDDLQTQLTILNNQETTLKKELLDIGLVIGNRADQLLQMIKLYRERVQVGEAAVNTTLNSPEEVEAQFNARLRIIEGLVTRVEINKQGKLLVTTEIRLYDSCTVYNKALPQ